MNEKEKPLSFDDVISKAVKDHFEAIEIREDEKIEQWNELISELERMKQQKKSKKSTQLFIAISASIVLITFSFFQAESISAFNWLKKILLEEEETLTKVNIMDDRNKLSKDNVEETSFTPFYNPFSIEFETTDEAEKHIGQKILTPTYLPETATLLNINILYTNKNQIDEISQRYLYQSEEIVVTQQRKIITFSHHFDNEDSTISNRKTLNDGKLFIKYNNEVKKLIWISEQFQFIIEANLQEEELIKIAQSIQ